MPLIYCFNILMSAVNLKFIDANVMRAAKIQVPINIIFSEGLVTGIEDWLPTLRMEALSSVIALIDIVAITLKFSSVACSSNVCCRIALNKYHMVIVRSCMQTFIYYANASFYFIYLAHVKSYITNLSEISYILLVL